MKKHVIRWHPNWNCKHKIEHERIVEVKLRSGTITIVEGFTDSVWSIFDLQSDIVEWRRISRKEKIAYELMTL